MHKIRVSTGLLHVGQGIMVELSPTQAAARRLGLKPMGGDIYRTENVLQFKAGEIIGIAATDIAKHERHLVADLSAPVAAASPPVSPVSTPAARRRR